MNALSKSCTNTQDVIYVDDDIVVANKPSNLLCVPGRAEKDSLATRWVPARLFTLPVTPLYLHHDSSRRFERNLLADI